MIPAFPGPLSSRFLLSCTGKRGRTKSLPEIIREIAKNFVSAFLAETVWKQTGITHRRVLHPPARKTPAGTGPTGVLEFLAAAERHALQHVPPPGERVFTLCRRSFFRTTAGRRRRLPGGRRCVLPHWPGTSAGRTSSCCRSRRRSSARRRSFASRGPRWAA